MQKVFTSSWCDWPGCAKEAMTQVDITKGQPTKNLLTWFYSPGKGHKPRVIANDLCDLHFEEAIMMRDKLKVNGRLVTDEPYTGNGNATE